MASIDLYWLPLGAGGWFVRLNGRVYEAVRALVERRRPLDLYHSALKVRLGEERFVVENAWPIPDADGPARGVIVQGPVASRHAVASPRRLSDDPDQARRLLDLVASLPTPVWGRDELATGDMWNSNSVIAWLLARSGLPAASIGPPPGGRAPGWHAGITAAECPNQVIGFAHGRAKPGARTRSRPNPPFRTGTPARPHHPRAHPS
jgi:hypothetical protein